MHCIIPYFASDFPRVKSRIFLGIIPYSLIKSHCENLKGDLYLDQHQLLDVNSSAAVYIATCQFQVLLGVSQSFCLDNATCSIIKVPRQGAVRLDPSSGNALLLEKVCKCSPDSQPRSFFNIYSDRNLFFNSIGINQ